MDISSLGENLGDVVEHFKKCCINNILDVIKDAIIVESRMIPESDSEYEGVLGLLYPIFFVYVLLFMCAQVT